MSEPNPNIRLGIAGSGAIAIGLAKAAGPNVDTVLRARSEESAERARSRLDDNVRVVTEIGELGDRTYVVEAIAEDHDTKVELLSQVNAHLAEDAVLATTTSSLSVNRLAEDSGRAQKFAGLHVFNPVHRMDLVELAFPDEPTRPPAPPRPSCARPWARPWSRCPTSPASWSTGCCSRSPSRPWSSPRRPASAEDIDLVHEAGYRHPIDPLALLDWWAWTSRRPSVGGGAPIPQHIDDLIKQAMSAARAARAVTSTTESTWSPRRPASLRRC